MTSIIKQFMFTSHNKLLTNLKQGLSYTESFLFLGFVNVNFSVFEQQIKLSNLLLDVTWWSNEEDKSEKCSRVREAPFAANPSQCFYQLYIPRNVIFCPLFCFLQKLLSSNILK